MMNNCNCCDDNEIKITLEDESPIEINLNDEMSVITTKNHNELNNLDYEHSGHIGFMPSNPDNLNDFDSTATNDDITLFGNDSTNPGKITLSDLHDRIVKIDGIKVNNTELLPDSENKINIDLTNYSLGNQTVARATLSVNTTTYVVTLTTYDRDNNILNTSQIDLPEESVVIGGRYDSVNKALILTLQNGTEITIPVGDLISGLQTEITSQNPLSSDLVDDTNNTHKFVSSAEKNQITLNATAIQNIKDGTNIDSFADVELGLAGKIDKSKIGYIELSGSSGTLTQEQFAECQKDIAVIHHTNTNEWLIKTSIFADEIVFTFFDGTSESTATGGIRLHTYNISIATTNLNWLLSYGGPTLYNQSQTNTLLSNKQNNLIDSTSIEIVNDSPSVKQSYIDSQFMTDLEMATMLSEVFD